MDSTASLNLLPSLCSFVFEHYRPLHNGQWPNLHTEIYFPHLSNTRTSLCRHLQEDFEFQHHALRMRLVLPTVVWLTLVNQLCRVHGHLFDSTPCDSYVFAVQHVLHHVPIKTLQPLSFGCKALNMLQDCLCPDQRAAIPDEGLQHYAWIVETS